MCFKDEDEEMTKYVECFFCGKKFKERGIKNHERKCEEKWFKCESLYSIYIFLKNEFLFE